MSLTLQAASSNTCDILNTPSATDYLHSLSAAPLGLTVSCGVVSLVTVIVYIEVLYKLYRSPANPGYPRLKAVILLAIYPVTSINALLAIIVPRASGLCDLTVALYFAFCSYVFCQTIIGLFGGKSQMSEVLQHEVIPTRSPPLCCCLACLPSPEVTRHRLNVLHWLVRQFVIVHPILSFSTGVIAADNLMFGGTRMSPGSGAVLQAIRVIDTLSTLVAVYGNSMLFRLAGEPLAAYNFRAKFFLLQAVLLLVNLQRMVLSGLIVGNVVGCLPPLNVEATSNIIHHMLLVAYMLVLSVIARACYRRDSQILHRNGSSPGQGRALEDSITVQTKAPYPSQYTSQYV